MNLLNAPFSDWHPFVFILLAGAVPTQMWRWLGAFLSRSLQEDSEFLRWVKAVATALVAGLIANLVIFPSGALEAVPFVIRITALVTGYVVFMMTRTQIIWGILAGEAVLLSGALFFG